MDNSPYKNFNSSKNKDKYYSNLIEYNKKLHKNNQSLESKINSEIKIYENENNIIIQSNDDSNHSYDDDFYGFNKITTQDFEEIKPYIMYMKTENKNNINYEEIADLFKNLMKEKEEKNILYY